MVDKPEGIRYRLEITGRAGWFVPAFEAVMPKGMPRADVQTRMATAMGTYGSRYVADPERGEAYKLIEVPRRNMGFCAKGTCKTRR